MAQQFHLDAVYGKQSVPVFKIRKNGPNHTVVDMLVKIMLRGKVEDSWLSGDNHQILPTETQKNTCYVLAQKTDYDAAETYALSLAKDILSRHAHISVVEVDVEERPWERLVVNNKPHSHAFSKPRDPHKLTCKVVAPRDGPPTVTSGVKDLCLMKTTQSGFAGYIQDEYTTLQPTGAGSANPDRIMCTELEATWTWGSLPQNIREANAGVLNQLLVMWSGDPVDGKFSKSVQETAYKMATEALILFPGLNEVYLATPNIHHYRSDLEQFGLRNPNVVFQSTDCHTTASGRIETRVSRPRARL